MLLTNTENKEKLKDTEFLWNPEEDIVMYFTNMYKEKERLKNRNQLGRHAKVHAGGG